MPILAGQAALDIGIISSSLISATGTACVSEHQPSTRVQLCVTSPSPNARRARYGLRWEDAEVAEDAGVAQARMLVGLLRDEIAEISDKLKAPDSDVHRRTEHGHHRRVRRAAVLRRQFYEAHRLLDGLYRRFPETLDASHPRRAARRGVSFCLAVRSTTVAPTLLRPRPNTRHAHAVVTLE